MTKQNRIFLSWVLSIAVAVSPMTAFSAKDDNKNKTNYAEAYANGMAKLAAEGDDLVAEGLREVSAIPVAESLLETLNLAAKPLDITAEATQAAIDGRELEEEGREPIDVLNVDVEVALAAISAFASSLDRIHKESQINSSTESMDSALHNEIQERLELLHLFYAQQKESNEYDLNIIANVIADVEDNSPDDEERLNKLKKVQQELEDHFENLTKIVATTAQLVDDFKSFNAKVPRLADFLKDNNIDVDANYFTSLHSLEAQTVLFSDRNQIDQILKSRQERFEQNFRGKVDKLAKDLDKLIEQEEVARILLAIERRDTLFAFREKPEHIVMMGQPGVGKDTTVEIWAKSKHGDDWEAHVYRVDKLQTKADKNKFLGSSSGHVDSDQLPPVFEFLVQHSGGRYKIEEIKHPLTKAVTGKRIVKNPDWKPGMVMRGYNAPEDAIVFINEFHEWDMDIKDEILKEFIESGRLYLSNPNEGVEYIDVPVNIAIATNDGEGLISSRNVDGTRFGPKLTYEQSIKKHEAIKDDKDLLKQELRKQPPGNDGKVNGGKRGTSEALVNRLFNVVILRPISPDGLQQIAHIKLKDLRQRLSTRLDPDFGAIDLMWDSDLDAFVQQYKYVAEENARPIKDKVKALIEDTIFAAIDEGQIKPSKNENQPQKLRLHIRDNKNGTFNLVIKSDEQDEPVERLITETLGTKEQDPLTDDEVDRLLDLERRFKEKVFGIGSIAKKLARAILTTQENQHLNHEDPDVKLPKARIFAFFGMSSTGKTEAAKVLTEELTGSRENLGTMNFTPVRTAEQMEHFLYGRKGSNLPSEFMKIYDRNGGKVVINLDELTEVPLPVLKALYDFFREPIVTGFNDGRDRPMNGVTFIINGNAGEEWYTGIPAEVPELERLLSMARIYQQALHNPRAQRVMLEKYMSQALINRIGLENIFFFPPLIYKSVRELTHLKIKMAIKDLEPTKGRHGVYLGFEDQETYVKLIEAVEEHGFYIDEQGASIDRAARSILVENLKAEIRTAKVANKSKVKVISIENVTIDKKLKLYGYKITLQAEGSDEKIEVVIDGKKPEHTLVDREMDQIMTAYHEAGHEILRNVFLSETSRSEGISIIPGVDVIGNRWVYYAGVARWEELERVVKNRQTILRDMAISFGGWVAETMVSHGNVHSAGKHNDMQEATRMAQLAVAGFGLTDRLDFVTMQHGQTLNDFIANLTPDQKQIFNEEVSKLMQEAEQMARLGISANFENAFVPMAKELAEKGDMTAEDMEIFYKNHKVIRDGDSGVREISEKFIKGELELPYGISANPAKQGENKSASTSNQLESFFVTEEARNQTVKAEIISEELMPKSVASIQQIAAEMKAKQVAEVDLSDFPKWDELKDNKKETLNNALDALGLNTEKDSNTAKGESDCEASLKTRK